ncbi:MAG: hypothetical protein ACI9T9_002194, partial [Oleiphilaceae bacterium]
MKKKDDKVADNIEGILNGLSELVGKLKDVAETGEEMKRSGVFDVDPGAGK